MYLIKLENLSLEFVVHLCYQCEVIIIHELIKRCVWNHIYISVSYTHLDVYKRQVPKNKHEVRSLLGLCSYYRRFVKGFATIAKPLHELTENKRNFQWSRDCEQAFRTLKIALCSQPILAFPASEGKYIVDTDASNTGLGAVLSKVQNGEERVIAYYSKTLSKPERNYCVTRRELLAIVRALVHFHKYLYGREFSLRTDHATLAWLLRFKNPEGQLARWLERLQAYNFKV